MNKEFSLQLDAIRGRSAFAVLMTHIYAWFMLPIVGLKGRVGMTTGSVAYYAVLIFFVLSGYLITHSLLLNRQKNGGIDVPVFLSARALKILPPFAFAIVLSICALTSWVQFPKGADGYVSGARQFATGDKRRDFFDLVEQRGGSRYEFHYYQWSPRGEILSVGFQESLVS